MINEKLKSELEMFVSVYYIDNAKEKQERKEQEIIIKNKEETKEDFDTFMQNVMCRSNFESICLKNSTGLIDDYIETKKDEITFSEYLLHLIDKSGESDTTIYKRAGLDRRLFSKIRSNKNYQPSKNTVFTLLLALKLDGDDAAILLSKAGYAFSFNKLTDIIIMFCIDQKIYDLYKVDELLLEYNQKPLASD